MFMPCLAIHFKKIRKYGVKKSGFDLRSEYKSSNPVSDLVSLIVCLESPRITVKLALLENANYDHIVRQWLQAKA